LPPVAQEWEHGQAWSLRRARRLAPEPLREPLQPVLLAQMPVVLLERMASPAPRLAPRALDVQPSPQRLWFLSPSWRQLRLLLQHPLRRASTCAPSPRRRREWSWNGSFSL
jgi:hypothetical protein